MVSALDELLDLSGEEKLKRGLVYTPAEIAQQPATWESTYSIFQKRRSGAGGISRRRWFR